MFKPADAFPPPEARGGASSTKYWLGKRNPTHRAATAENQPRRCQDAPATQDDGKPPPKGEQPKSCFRAQQDPERVPENREPVPGMPAG